MALPSYLLIRVDIPAIGISRTAQLSLCRAKYEVLTQKVMRWCEDVKRWDPNHTVIHDQLGIDFHKEMVEKIANAASESSDMHSNPGITTSRRRSMDRTQLNDAFRSRTGSHEPFDVNARSVSLDEISKICPRKGSATPPQQRSTARPVNQYEQGLLRSLDKNIATLKEKGYGLVCAVDGEAAIKPPQSTKHERRRPSNCASGRRQVLDEELLAEGQKLPALVPSPRSPSGHFLPLRAALLNSVSGAQEQDTRTVSPQRRASSKA
eukprot:TRINITY_DN17339_c0_g1_i1.p1 TRINITY_DN17339_c0_g1~~TRINITY_DN17339_c0_g1_i1.p1  ORF type:complete len:265 (-),score=38.82 TRINITY_DN17339_c0_g1_i1:41-835(-)